VQARKGSFSMALYLIDPVRQFMASQVFRQDFLIIEDACAGDERQPSLLKERRLQQLCMQSGYLSRDDCVRIRQHISDDKAPDTADAVSLWLVQSYLPYCVRCVGRSDQLNTSSSNTTVAAINKILVSSWLDVDEYRYLLQLPADIHALLIDHSGALLAA